MSEHDKCDCVLCVAIDKEEAIYKDDYVTVLNTKNLKGHKRRIMIVWNKHNDYHYSSKNQDYMIRNLENIGKNVFEYASKFIIMDTTFATIRDHYHLVACAIDPNTEDWEQVLKTNWLKVVTVR